MKGNSSLNICCFFNFKNGALVLVVAGIVEVVTSLEIVVVVRVEVSNTLVVVIILGRVVVGGSCLIVTDTEVVDTLLTGGEKVFVVTAVILLTCS